MKYEITILTAEHRHTTVVEHATGPMLALIAGLNQFYSSEEPDWPPTSPILGVQVQGEGQSHAYREFSA